MARLDTIRALEKRGLSPQLAEKTVDLGYLLGTLKKADLKTFFEDSKFFARGKFVGAARAKEKPPKSPAAHKAAGSRDARWLH